MASLAKHFSMELQKTAILVQPTSWEDLILAFHKVQVYFPKATAKCASGLMDTHPVRWCQDLMMIMTIKGR